MSLEITIYQCECCGEFVRLADMAKCPDCGGTYCTSCMMENRCRPCHREMVRLFVGDKWSDRAVAVFADFLERCDR